MKNLRLKDGRMIKGGWVAPPTAKYAGKDYLTEESFSDVKESGVNLLYSFIDPATEKEDLEKYLTLCDKYDVYAMVYERSLREDNADIESIKERIKYYKTHKSVYGINASDEPGMNSYSAFKKNYDAIKEDLGDLVFYINLMPMYANLSQLQKGWWTLDFQQASDDDYFDYLNDFCKVVNPPLLSYDFYPFKHEKGVCDPRYFDQLCMVNDFACKNNIPFWNFTQLTSWSPDAIRNTTYSEIAWLNNTSIACGATGLQYFCYWTPNDSGGERFLSAMIRNGSKTKHYYFVKDLNEKLSYIENYILDATYKETYAFGDTLCGFPNKYNKVGNSKVFTYCDGILIGYFDYKGKDMYYVVNGSVLEARAVDIYFKESIAATVIYGRETEKVSSNAVIKVLNAGEAMLIIVD